MSERRMICPNCLGTNTHVQVVTEHKMKRKHRNIIMWILFWWWVELLAWVFLFVPRLLIMVFGGKKQKIVSSSHSVGVCNSCGHTWKI